MLLIEINRVRGFLFAVVDVEWFSSIKQEKATRSCLPEFNLACMACTFWLVAQIFTGEIVDEHCVRTHT